ncbi:glycosidase [candidate division KSB1 bacterium]|nr:glycosidase [candidate division KSB1 bacterium]
MHDEKELKINIQKKSSIFLLLLFSFNCKKSVNEPQNQPEETVAKPLLGVYVGNTPSDVGTFETWLGRPVDGILGYTGHASWQDYDGSVGWAAGLWRDQQRKIFWSVPLIPKEASLEMAAKGAYNSHYLAAAKNLANFRQQDSVLYIRTGWEFNGDWFPWSAIGKSEQFIGAWRNFVTSFKSVSGRFRFDWCPNFGDTGMSPEEAYPGDDYVDIIGMDIYDETIWCKIKDPVARWEFNLTEPYGLNWHRDFATAHNKPMSYPEWGVGGNGSGDNPYFVEKMAQWCEENQVVYQTYWNSNAAYPGKLSDNQYPQTAAKYREVFGEE